MQQTQSCVATWRDFERFYAALALHARAPCRRGICLKERAVLHWPSWTSAVDCHRRPRRRKLRGSCGAPRRRHDPTIEPPGRAGPGRSSGRSSIRHSRRPTSASTGSNTCEMPASRKMPRSSRRRGKSPASWQAPCEPREGTHSGTQETASDDPELYTSNFTLRTLHFELQPLTFLTFEL